MCVLVRLAAVCLLLAITVLPLGTSRAETKNRIERERIKLQNVSEKIKKQKKQLKEVEKEEAAVISRLNQIEKRLLKQNSEYQNVVGEIKQIKKDIRKARFQITTLQQKADRQEQFLQKRLGALYKYYRRSGLRILLSSNTYNDFLRQEKALSTIVGRDHEILSQSLSTISRKRAQQEALQSRKDALMAAKQQLEEKRNQIKTTREQKATYLNEIKQKKSLQLKALQELEEYSKQLQDFIDTLPRNKQKYTAKGIKFSKMRRRLNFPVKGKIVSRFGRREHPELHTFTFQKGINIQAAQGTPVKAVYDGKVIFADWFRGYGYMIIIDHGESYYSLSAHASKLLKKVDDLVYEGETIAYVGDTNSIKGEGLYFEIRHHGKPQDPLNWLKKGGNK